MMTVQLNIAFEINLLHNYFDDSQQFGLLIVPSNETEEIIKKYGLISQSFNNQFKLFSKSNPHLTAQLNHIKSVTQKDYFEFDLISNQPAFNLYTELPDNWNSTISYSNKNASLISNELVLQPNYNETIKEGCVGVIKIYFDELMEQLNKASTYSISFQARKTQWNYYIVNRSNIELENPFIKLEESELFGSPQSVTLLTGENALHFSTSKNLIPLGSTTKQKIDLADSIDQSDMTLQAQKKVKIIYSGLPAATASNTVLEMDGEDVVFKSLMYVYL